MEGNPQGWGKAASFVDEALADRPDLVVHGCDLPATARALRDLLATSGSVFDRGVPVRVTQPADGGPPTAVKLTVNNVVMEVHHLCRPVKVNQQGVVPVTLPDRVARMYLDMAGEWGLPSLAGITTAPLLAPDGTVRTADGYDRVTGLWCSSVPKLRLPERPTRADAEAALQILRQVFFAGSGSVLRRIRNGIVPCLQIS